MAADHNDILILIYKLQKKNQDAELVKIQFQSCSAADSHSQ